MEEVPPLLPAIGKQYPPFLSEDPSVQGKRRARTRNLWISRKVADGASTVVRKTNNKRVRTRMRSFIHPLPVTR
jgi:hypothetical protein